MPLLSDLCHTGGKDRTLELFRALREADSRVLDRIWGLGLSQNIR